MEIEKYEIRSQIRFVDNEERNVRAFPIATSPPAQSADTAEQTKNEKTAFQFTEKEILKMPKKYRPLFRTHKINGHVRLRANGVYEIRCQIDKKPITATSKSLETAKAKFIAALSALNKEDSNDKSTPVCFIDYANTWLKTAKMPFVKANTYKEYERTLNTDIAPNFKNREIATIKQTELQELINVYIDTERFRTAKKVYQMLAAIFDYAVTDELIRRSPMERVKIAKYEQERGVPLDRKEESALIAAFRADQSPLRQAFVFMLYSGVRRSELSTVDVKDGWITLTCSKQVKGRAEKQRSLPISPMLSALMPMICVQDIIKITPAMLTKHFKKLFPCHHLHDLRHTFITRAQECGIPREMVSLWAGHAADSSTTTRVYTHLEQNKEHQLEEMRRFSYDLDPILDPTFCE